MRFLMTLLLTAVMCFQSLGSTLAPGVEVDISNCQYLDAE